jgi:hypothetical protein
MIKQALIADSIKFFKKDFLQKWNLKEYYDSTQPCVFFGGKELSAHIHEHTGFKLILPSVPNDIPNFNIVKNIKDMYIIGQYMGLSFHIKKILPIWKGGMILTDDTKAAEWFKRARYEGRSEKYYKDDDIEFLGWNMYMTPQQAAQGLAIMQNLPLHNSDQGELNGYRDLTEFTVFKNNKIIK